MSKKSDPPPPAVTQSSQSLNAAEDPDLFSEASTYEETNDNAALVGSDIVGRYLAEIRKYPLLTREEEQELAIALYEKNDPTAAEKLVTSNLRFVVKIAAEYSKFGAKLIDLIQEGNVGLMHAVKEFNPYKGVRLITYAVWWIRGYIQEYLMRQHSLVRIGTTANQRKLFYQLQKQKEELDRLGPEQAAQLLSGRLGIPEQEITEMQKRLSGRDVSLDQTMTADSSTRLIDVQSSSSEASLDEQLAHFEELTKLNESIDDLKQDLSEKELFLLENRLLTDQAMTLQEIGDQFGVTREAVRQMETRLLAKLKSRFVEKS